MLYYNKPRALVPQAVHVAALTWFNSKISLLVVRSLINTTTKSIIDGDENGRLVRKEYERRPPCGDSETLNKE